MTSHIETLGIASDEGVIAGKSSRFVPAKAGIHGLAKRNGLLPHRKAGVAVHLVALIGAFAVASIAVAIVVPVLSEGGSVPVFVIAVLGLMSACVAGLFFVAGAIMRYKTWGRYAGILCGLASLASFPVGTLIGGYVLWQLIFGWADGAAET